MFVSLSLAYWFFTILIRSDSQQTTNKARHDAICMQEYPYFNFWAMGSAANVLRAPGSTVK